MCEIGVASRVGEGSSFWIELPTTSLPPVHDQVSPRIVTEEADAWAVRRLTVLYVEDNESNVRLVEQIMTLRPGVTLKIAMQGHLAIELAEEHAPDLILLDLNLPDISGEDVLERLMANKRTATIPVVVVSADATLEQRKRLLARGATDYLTKPFNIPELLSVIDGSGTTRPERRGSPRATAPVEPVLATKQRATDIPAFVHDLNNLLGVIRLSQRLVARNVTDTSQLHRLSMIEDATDKAIALAAELRQ
jgi:CheY-like chemotaxis protein